MSAEKTLVIDLPTLRLDWIESEMPRLHAIARGWHQGAIAPVFPGLTCTAQATLTTGEPPAKHGVVANGIFDRATRVPEMWTFPDTEVQARRIWEDYGASGKRTGVFFFLNIRDAKADAAILPKPIHRDDGSMEMWCWHKPEGLYPRLVKQLNHFNLLKFWGPMAGIESSKWIAEAARRTIVEEKLDLSFVYLPHTDYAPQKFGPASDVYRKAHRELDGVVCDLIESLQSEVAELNVVIVSEYAITDVNRWVEPNVILRRAGLLAVETRDGREYLDYANSPAFAMADHQIAHVYCRRDDDVEKIRALFEAEDAIDEVITEPARYGLDHARSGELILVAKRDAWFTYHWWEDFAVAPPFAKTIDIHNKPGYDPLEMFWDVNINGTAQDPALIKGSHGAFARDPDQQAAIVSNLEGIETARSTGDVHRALRARIGAAAARA